MVDIKNLDEMIERQRERLAARPVEREVCRVHEWGNRYKSASGRRVCVKCGYVTDAPFEALGVAERPSR